MRAYLMLRTKLFSWRRTGARKIHVGRPAPGGLDRRRWLNMFQSTFPVQRLRRRYRDVLRAQVAATLENPDKAAVEVGLRDLFAALGG